ncbi:putative nuclease HARBI1 [Leptopilina boulardi]|uniref:putative nuclease HARBI1 n=1 Tax=Leptopilina boulardi TaxID=63433 RepID=UPI0021F5867D|nr:putative nuclease HARBI1 [Leptopilina boulardi]
MHIANLLCELAHKFIQWPTGEMIRSNQEEFLLIANFPGVLGCIDGCHIRISAPHDYADIYFNRKGFYSINMQAICDAHMLFIDIYAACPGSVNDARVWTLSTIREKSLRNYEHYFPEQTHILGDKIYSVLFNLIPPFKDYVNMRIRERHFNKIHARTRQVIERAFALLVARFRRLKHLYLQNVAYASLIILACSCLHNICLSLDDRLAEEIILNIDADELDNVEDVENDDDVLPENVPFHPELKRQIIVDELYLNH